MMNVVVDASVLIAVISGEAERDRLIKLTRGFDLIAPGSIYWEVGNAFSAMLKRKRANIDQVLMALEAFHNIPIRYVDIDLDSSLEIAARLGIYAYDAYLIECATRYKAPVLTLDKNLTECARQLDIGVVEV
jgi:predicted nucleic acid-binding protein